MPMVVCRGLLTTLCMLPSAVVAAALEWREGEDARLLVWFKRAAEKAQIKDTSAEILAHMDIDSLVRMIGRLNIKPNNAQSWVLDLLFEVLFKMNTTKAASCLRKLYSQEMLPTILEYGSDHGGNPSKIGEIQCMINRGPSDASKASKAADASKASKAEDASKAADASDSSKALDASKASDDPYASDASDASSGQGFTWNKVLVKYWASRGFDHSHWASDASDAGPDDGLQTQLPPACEASDVPDDDTHSTSDASDAGPENRSHTELPPACEASDVPDDDTHSTSNNSQVMHFSPCLRIVASIVYHGAKSMFYVQDETDDLVSPTSSEKEWGRRVQRYKRQSQYRKDREEEQKRRRL